MSENRFTLFGMRSRWLAGKVDRRHFFFKASLLAGGTEKS
ncbi:hypothetical protein CES86_2321 [Brucella lupini]|uniref:Uncharacterized protein n=1 Tax=Brucella lupini TaxID=255457 RepID=A0A256GRH9_9HYPH|nr:hypothetical protein CES86_2321 [Brucella lupini]